MQVGTAAPVEIIIFAVASSNKFYAPTVLFEKENVFSPVPLGFVASCHCTSKPATTLKTSMTDNYKNIVKIGRSGVHIRIKSAVLAGIFMLFLGLDCKISKFRIQVFITRRTVRNAPNNFR